MNNSPALLKAGASIPSDGRNVANPSAPRATQPAPTECTTDEDRRLDFWLGTWECATLPENSSEMGTCLFDNSFLRSPKRGRERRVKVPLQRKLPASALIEKADRCARADRFGSSARPPRRGRPPWTRLSGSSRAAPSTARHLSVPRRSTQQHLRQGRRVAFVRRDRPQRSTGPRALRAPRMERTRDALLPLAAPRAPRAPRLLGTFSLTPLGNSCTSRWIPQHYLPDEQRDFSRIMLVRKELARSYRGY